MSSKIVDELRALDMRPEGLEIWLAYCEKKQELEAAQEEIERLREQLKVNNDKAREAVRQAGAKLHPRVAAIRALKDSGDE